MGDDAEWNQLLRDAMAAPPTSAPRLSGTTRVAGQFPGLVEPGNIDLTKRPRVKNPDGRYSSVRSASFNIDGSEVLIPTVSDGPGARLLSDDEAVAQYMKTGRHLGKFQNPDAATRYAKALHEQQEAAGYGLAAPPAPAAPPTRYRAPSESMSDVDLGIARGPEYPRPGAGLTPGSPALGRTSEEREAILARENPLADDWIGQSVIGGLVGGAAGRATMEAATALRAAPAVARIVGAGVGGGTANYVQGGDFGSGALLGGGLAAIGPVRRAIGGALAPGAQQRVAARAVRETISGETGARPKTAAKLVERAGDELGNVKQLFADEPALEKTLATKAATDPAKAGTVVRAAIEKVSGETAPMLDAITQTTGGPRLIDIVAKNDQLRRTFLKAGQVDAAAAVDRANTTLKNMYGTDGMVPEGLRLDARAIQNMKNTIGNVAFDVGTPATVRRTVGRGLWGVLSGELEAQAAQTPGLDVARLRALNQNMSVLIPMRDALDERVARAARGTPTLADRFRNAVHLGAPAVGAAAGAHGGAGGALGGAVAGIVVPRVAEGAARAGAAIARRADYALARGASAAPIAAPVPIAGLSGVSAALARGDHEATVPALAQEVFGQ